MQGLITLVVLVGVVAIIAIIAFVIYKTTHPKLKQNDKPNDEEILKDELNRVLKPIEDEKTAKEISEYKDEDED